MAAATAGVRIGLVGSTSVGLGGGEPTFFRYLAQGFNQLGHRVALFNPGPPVDQFLSAEVRNLNGREKTGGLFYRLERSRSALRSWVARTGPLSPWITTLYMRTAARRMGRLVSSGPPCAFYLATGNTAPLACHLAGVPYVALCVSMIHRTYEHVFRTRPMPESVRRHFVRHIARMERDGLRGARAWLANSLDLQDYLREFAGARQVALLWSPVDLQKGQDLTAAQARATLGVPQDANVVATVGRMDATKGVDVLLKAAAGLQGQLPRLQVILAGDGVLEPRYRRMAADLGVPARFYGFRKDVESFYRAADVVVLLFPTLGGTSHALLEAMACGATVVSNRIYGRDSVPFEDQLIYADVGSPDSVRDALARALSDSGLRREMGRRARSYVERNHSWEQFLATLEGVVDQMSRQHTKEELWTV